MNERPPMAATPGAETPTLDLPKGPETGDFSYAGHPAVQVGGAGQTSFIPAPQPEEESVQGD